jgi:hypothetical protein
MLLDRCWAAAGLLLGSSNGCPLSPPIPHPTRSCKARPTPTPHPAAQASQSELSIVDFVLDDPTVAALASRAEVVRVLSSVGFDDAMQAMQVRGAGARWAGVLRWAAGL